MHIVVLVESKLIVAELGVLNVDYLDLDMLRVVYDACLISPLFSV
jgi:hypothetical protein